MYRCYNTKCINGKTNTNGEFEPKELMPNKKGFMESWYCTRECKSKVITAPIEPEGKPRTVREVQVWLKKMADKKRKENINL